MPCGSLRSAQCRLCGALTLHRRCPTKFPKHTDAAGGAAKNGGGLLRPVGNLPLKIPSAMRKRAYDETTVGVVFGRWFENAWNNAVLTRGRWDSVGLAGPQNAMQPSLLGRAGTPAPPSSPPSPAPRRAARRSSSHRRTGPPTAARRRRGPRRLAGQWTERRPAPGRRQKQRRRAPRRQQSRQKTQAGLTSGTQTPTWTMARGEPGWASCVWVGGQARSPLLGMHHGGGGLAQCCMKSAAGTVRKACGQDGLASQLPLCPTHAAVTPRTRTGGSAWSGRRRRSCRASTAPSPTSTRCPGRTKSRFERLGSAALTGGWAPLWEGGRPGSSSACRPGWAAYFWPCGHRRDCVSGGGRRTAAPTGQWAAYDLCSFVLTRICS